MGMSELDVLQALRCDTSRSAHTIRREICQKKGIRESGWRFNQVVVGVYFALFHFSFLGYVDLIDLKLSPDEISKQSECTTMEWQLTESGVARRRKLATKKSTPLWHRLAGHF